MGSDYLKTKQKDEKTMNAMLLLKQTNYIGHVSC